MAVDGRTGHDPDQPWFKAIPIQARTVQGQRAGLVSRTMANTIDISVLAVSLGACYLAVSGVMFVANPVRFSFPAPPRAVLVAVATALTTAYFTVWWMATGRTFGDQLLGLRVIDRRGGPPRTMVALVRAVVCLLFPLGLLWAAGPRRRSVADLLLRTSVVYDWNP